MEILVLKGMQSDPEEGNSSPLVLSFEGTNKDSEAAFEQFSGSNTQRSFAQTFSVPVLLYFNVNKLRLARDT